METTVSFPRGTPHPNYWPIEVRKHVDGLRVFVGPVPLDWMSWLDGLRYRLTKRIPPHMKVHAEWCRAYY